MKECGGEEVRVVFAEFVVEKVLFVVENWTWNRARRQIVNALLGGGERVEPEKRIVGFQVFSIETDAF